MSDKQEYKTVMDYINNQPENTKRALKELRKCILIAAPNATELLNYGIPAFTLVKGGKREEQISLGI